MIFCTEFMCPSDQTNRVPKAVVGLIHGTFARQAPWTRDTSAFCQHLEAQVDGSVLFWQPSWSASNSLSDRLDGALNLASEFAAKREQYPEASHFLVGHSHGGSVLWYALADPNVQQHLAGAIFLSTPFLVFEKRRLSVLYGSLPWGVATLVSFPVAYYLGKWLFSIGLPWLWLAGTSIFAVAIMLALWFAVGCVVGMWLHGRDCPVYELTERIPRVNIDASKVFIVRSSSDEAANVLGFTSLLLALVQQMLFVLCRLTNPEVFPRPEQLHVESVADGNPIFGLSRALGQIVATVVLLPFGPPLILLLSVIGGVLMLPFGTDLFWHLIYMQVGAEPTPPGNWQFTHVSDDSIDNTNGIVPTGMAHSSYARRQTVAAIAEWIRHHLRAERHSTPVRTSTSA